MQRLFSKILQTMFGHLASTGRALVLGMTKSSGSGELDAAV